MRAQKGGQWERDISKKLSLWWSKGERDDYFWRTAQSGGRATQRRKQGKKTSNSYGDISSTHECSVGFINTFSLELKRGYSKDISMLKIFDGMPRKSLPILFDFWNQCESDRINGGRRHSLVFFKRDRCREMIMFRVSLFLKLSRYFGKPNYPWGRVDCGDAYAIPSLIFMRLEDWLEWLDPEVLNELIEKEEI